MVQAGISDDLIITQLRQGGRSHTLAPSEIIKLKKAKVSEAVIKEMLSPASSTNATPSVTPAPSPSATASPKTTQAGSTLSSESSTEKVSERKKATACSGL